jgi:hypothetical protein
MMTAIMNKLTRDFAVGTPPLCQKGGTQFGLASISIVNLNTTFLYLAYALFCCISAAITEIIGNFLLLRWTAR